ncbi:MAG: aspartate aminotransferase family protein [Clostridiales bacterium]|jgi:predicted acetylornithine/succinylornithine family transaminase|nr:aspartate aminotransferase family protein [Clostridiales bacterium]
MSDLKNIGMNCIMNTYSRFPLVITKGEGCYVWDENGKKYLDFAAGIAVNSLGYGHVELIAAIEKQAKTLIHISNLYWTEPQVTLAEKLVENSSFDKVFFCNSGAEAVEGSIKLAKKYAAKHHPERFEIISMKDSFHGRTIGALSLTGQTKYQKGLAPLLSGVSFVEYNNYEALAAAVNEKTCAVILEPVQGEGGIHPADKEYMRQVRKLCYERDIALIFDEIQSGAGRTGKFFAFEHYEVSPDIATLAKGLAGGVPIGAVLAKDCFADAFAPGDHASTFGGNPVAASAANVVLTQIFENGLLEQAQTVGQYLGEQLKLIQSKYPGLIIDSRGLGLMRAIELTQPALPIINKCIRNGLLLVAAGSNVIRFVPPLIISKLHIDECMEILSAALSVK